MINRALYKYGIKSNINLFIIFIGVLSMYSVIIVGMYDPEIATIFEELSKSMPELMSLFGMHGDGSTLIGFLNQYLYGMLLLVLPLVFIIILTNKLITTYIDKGSIVYLLASNNNRVKIITTQIMVIITYITLLVVFNTLLVIISSNIMFPVALDVSKFIIINIGLVLILYTLSSIVLLFSCIFSDGRHAMLFGAGLPLLFYIIQMLVNLGNGLEILRYLTIFTLYNPLALIEGSINSYIMCAIMLIISIVLNVVSVAIFKKRDLSV